MARKTATVVIDSEGRDFGKQFTIEELPAYQAEEWFHRAMMLLARAGTEVPHDIFHHGAMGFATLGMGAVLSGLSKAPWTEVKALLDEMLVCLKSFRAPGAEASVNGLGSIKSQIEEPSTFIKLREEIISLHLGFSIRDEIWNFRETVAMQVTSNGQSIPTSQG